jgi:hypothetical protein
MLFKHKLEKRSCLTIKTGYYRLSENLQKTNDRENRPFLDVLNYQMGVFLRQTDNQKKALDFYNVSLKSI